MALPFWLTKLLVRTGIARFTPRARRLTDGGTAFLRYYSDRVLAAPVEELLDPAFVPGRVRPGRVRPEPARAAIGVRRQPRAIHRGPSRQPARVGLPELRAAIAARYHRSTAAR